MDSVNSPWRLDWKQGEQIGLGGQGIVFELQSKTDPTKRAVIKLLTERWRGNHQAKERMSREVEAMTTLNRVQANVPKVIDSFLDHPESDPYFIMEFIPGTLFKDWLEKNAPTDIETALTITRAVTETIELCHSQNIGHRDLKPANIILKDDESVIPFVLDFGISFDSMQSMIVTKDGDVFWNEFITLPECQDRLGGHQDPRSDITALAGIFFNCIVGEPPAVLLDGNGMPPQRRHFAKLEAAAKNSSELMRLKSFFDTSFSVAIDQRFQDLPTFRNQLNQFDQIKVDSESLADVSRSYVENLLERDRGAQLVSMRGLATGLVNEIQTDLGKKVKSETIPEFRLESISTDLRHIFARFPQGFPPTAVGGDRLLTDPASVLVLTGNKQPKIPVCAIVPIAVGMNTRIFVGGWVANNKQSRSNPLQSVDWNDAGSIDSSSTALEISNLIQAAVDIGYLQFKNQIRKMNMMLEGQL